MTARDLKLNALVLIAIGSPEEQEEGRNVLRMLRDGHYPEPTLENTVDALMEEFCATEGRLCFQMIRTALIQIYRNPALMDCLSSGIYKLLGEIYHTGYAEAGRNIHRGIEIIYRQGDSRKLDKFFQHQLSAITGLPTPYNFLRRCLQELRMRMDVSVE